MSQATFADIESNAPEPSSDVPRELESAGPVREGDLLALDRRHFDRERAYEVVESRSKSLVIYRESTDSEIELVRRRGSWYHGRSAHEHDVFLIANGDHRILNCSGCGEGMDPAEFVRRDGYSYYCAGCDR